MKKKVLYIALFSALALGLFSCQKEWICTCTAQSVSSGHSNLDIEDTIPSAVKSAAQADCNSFCNNYVTTYPFYANESATIVKH